MAEMCKKCGFSSNFCLPRPFTPCKTKLPRKMANRQSDCQMASCIQELDYIVAVLLFT